MVSSLLLTGGVISNRRGLRCLHRHLLGGGGGGGGVISNRRGLRRLHRHLLEVGGGGVSQTEEA